MHGLVSRVPKAGSGIMKRNSRCQGVGVKIANQKHGVLQGSWLDLASISIG